MISKPRQAVLGVSALFTPIISGVFLATIVLVIADWSASQIDSQIDRLIAIISFWAVVTAIGSLACIIATYIIAGGGNLPKWGLWILRGSTVVILTMTLSTIVSGDYLAGLIGTDVNLHDNGLAGFIVWSVLPLISVFQLLALWSVKTSHDENSQVAWS